MNAVAGTHSFDISKYYHSANVLLVKASIGNSKYLSDVYRLAVGAMH